MTTIRITITEVGVVDVPEAHGNSITYYRTPFIGGPIKLRVIIAGNTTYYKLTNVESIEWIS